MIELFFYTFGNKEKKKIWNKKLFSINDENDLFFKFFFSNSSFICKNFFKNSLKKPIHFFRNEYIKKTFFEVMFDMNTNNISLKIFLCV